MPAGASTAFTENVSLCSLYQGDGRIMTRVFQYHEEYAASERGMEDSGNTDCSQKALPTHLSLPPFSRSS